MSSKVVFSGRRMLLAGLVTGLLIGTVLALFADVHSDNNLFIPGPNSVLELSAKGVASDVRSWAVGKIGEEGARLFINNIAEPGNADTIINPRRGNVGIGTDSPDAKLDIDFGAAGSLNAGTPLGNGPGWIFFAANGHRRDLVGWNGGVYIGASASSGAAPSDQVMLRENGNVGIGLTDPAFKLDVAGAVHASGYPTSSDARFKTDVRQLSNVLEKLEQIHGVSFEWNELYESLGRSTGHREIGVIAQEVEAVFPELVTTWGDEAYRAVDYGRFTAVLVEAVKELEAENVTLQAQVQALLQRLDALERAVEELKQK